MTDKFKDENLVAYWKIPEETEIKTDKFKEEILELDYKKMVEDIDKFANNEFVADMELKILPKSKPFKQSEAVKMLSLLLKIYRISHSIHCKACRDEKYAKTHILKGDLIKK